MVLGMVSRLLRQRLEGTTLGHRISEKQHEAVEEDSADLPAAVGSRFLPFGSVPAEPQHEFARST